MNKKDTIPEEEDETDGNKGPLALLKKKNNLDDKTSNRMSLPNNNRMSHI